MAYTGGQVDSLLVQFENCCARQNAVKGSQVKLVAAESDLLKVAEKVRDLLELAVKGDKHHLADVFGGAGLQRFHRFRNGMSTVELSPMHAGDQRWGHLKDAMDMVEEILKQLGQFKPYMLHGPPDNIMYKGVPAKFVAGSVVNLVPEIEGGEPSEFVVEPALPEGLSVNLLGEVTGTLPADTPAMERECIITAKNGAGSARTSIKFSIVPPAPNSLKYPDVGDVFAGEALKVEPELEGGAASSFTVQPALPKGLEINQSTGVISGTPVKATPKCEYEVTASNASGSVSDKLSFAVMPAPPVALSYPGLRPVYSHGAVMHILPDVQLKGKEKKAEAAAPSSGWKRAKELVMKKDAVQNLASQVLTLVMDLEFSISPALPAGLSLIKKTGVITGTPTEAKDETTYTVKVKNDGGEVSTDIKFAIKLKPPSGLSYPGGDKVVCTGEPFSISPEVDGVVQEWSIEPALPKGLVFDATMGFISGIPAEVTDEGASWTVTAKNSEGETSAKVGFVVKRAAPSNLAYPSLLTAYPVRRPVEGLCPTFTGVVDEFTVSPELPAGMELDPKTGEITGTPKEVTEEKTYEVEAKNDTGSAKTSLKFAVKLIGPEDLKYPQIDDLYNVGEDVHLEPTIEGGVTSWQIEPALPEGMSFDDKTGVISGAPTTTAEEKQYVVTASNEAGGTSAVLTFKVTAPKPEGLSYPTAGDSYEVGQEVKLEPEVVSGICATYSVEPALPAGLAIDPKTGAISGTPTTATEKQAYTVTATNIAGSTSVELAFEVKEPPKPAADTDADESFAVLLEEVTDLADLPPEPKKRINWMLWMVHRAWLNDPTLVDFVFTNMKMPLPHVEPRIAPKLMKALENNTYITNLELANSNLQKPQGPELANALSQNKTLKVLNVDTNNLDADAIIGIAIALQGNTDSALEQIRFNNQKTLGDNMGRSVEEAIASLVEANQKITKLGCPIVDPNWRYKIDKAITRNNDAARRRRKAAREGDSSSAKEKTMTKIRLSDPPVGKEAWELFPTDDEKLACVSRALAEAKHMPTKDKFQQYAKGKGVSINYSQVAPLLKGFSTKLMTALVGSSLSVVDDKNTEHKGKLRAFAEKNDRWSLDVQTDAGGRYNFVALKTPVIEVSDGLAEWIQPADQA